MLLICKLIQNRVHSRQLAFAGACPWRRVKVNPGLLCQRNHHNDANTRTNNEEKPIRERQRIELLPDLRTEGHDGAALGLFHAGRSRKQSAGELMESLVSQPPTLTCIPIMFEWNCSRTATTLCMRAAPISPPNKRMPWKKALKVSALKGLASAPDSSACCASPPTNPTNAKERPAGRHELRQPEVVANPCTR